jgi:hypothetical protein
VPLYHTKYCSVGKIELLLPTFRSLSHVEVGEFPITLVQYKVALHCQKKDMKEAT